MARRSALEWFPQALLLDAARAALADSRGARCGVRRAGRLPGRAMLRERRWPSAGCSMRRALRRAPAPPRNAARAEPAVHRVRDVACAAPGACRGA
ncbi:hypothetical protein, partial [Trinickia dinghuensis]|uniref:hypothetical protein n=1 Tax=Trinickia dinghuensis TaxID=2291023 RepID=UPI001C6A0978